MSSASHARRLQHIRENHPNMHHHLLQLHDLFSALLHAQEMSILPINSHSLKTPSTKPVMLDEHLQKTDNRYTVIGKNDETIADKMTSLGENWRTAHYHNNMIETHASLLEKTITIHQPVGEQNKLNQTGATLFNKRSSLQAKIADRKKRLDQIGKTQIFKSLANPSPKDEKENNRVLTSAEQEITAEIDALNQQISAIQMELDALKIAGNPATETAITRPSIKETYEALVTASETLKDSVQTITDSKKTYCNVIISLGAIKKEHETILDDHIKAKELNDDNVGAFQDALNDYAAAVTAKIREQQMVYKEKEEQTTNMAAQILANLLPGHASNSHRLAKEGMLPERPKFREALAQQFDAITQHLSTLTPLDWIIYDLLDTLFIDDNVAVKQREQLGLSPIYGLAKTELGEPNLINRNLKLVKEHLQLFVGNANGIFSDNHDLILANVADAFSSIQIDDQTDTVFEKLFLKIAGHLGISKHTNLDSVDFAQEVIDRTEYAQRNEEIVASLVDLSAHFTKAAGETGADKTPIPLLDALGFLNSDKTDTVKPVRE